MRDGDVRTERGLERLIFFTDAVVAIAITLVVLPLVDEAKDLGKRSVAEFLSEDSAALVAAAISFVVIGAFWRDHHRLFERATGYTPTLLRANLLWLAGVVFLPVATVLYVSAGKGDRVAIAVYLGTVTAVMFMSRIEEGILIRSGLRSGPPLAKTDLWIETTPLFLISVALMLALVFPALGLWPVLILLLSRPVIRLAAMVIDRRG
jgi:uncharacterized membrane protein